MKACAKKVKRRGCFTCHLVFSVKKGRRLRPSPGRRLRPIPRAPGVQLADAPSGVRPDTPRRLRTSTETPVSLGPETPALPGDSGLLAPETPSLLVLQAFLRILRTPPETPAPVWPETPASPARMTKFDLQRPCPEPGRRWAGDFKVSAPRPETPVPQAGDSGVSEL